jgi:vancomycin resistance protein YoaR
MYPYALVKRALGVALVPVALAGGVFLIGAGVDSQSDEEGGQIRSDARVGEISLRGQTVSQAEHTLKESAPLEEIRLVSEASGRELALDAREAGVDFDTAATARKAYAVGREGNVFERLRERFSAATITVGVEPVVGYEREAGREAVERAVSRLEKEPQDATVVLDGLRVRVTGARDGYEVDAGATARNLEDAVSGLRAEIPIEGREVEPEVTTGEAEAAADEVREAVSEPLSLAALGEEWILGPSQVAGAVEVRSAGGKLDARLEKGGLGPYLGGMYESIHRAPQSASYEISGQTIRATGSRSGRKIRDRELFESLQSGLFEGQHHYQVPVTEVEPEMTTERAERLKPTELIGEYRTPYTGTGDASGARARNLQKSSGAVDGAVVAPGEVFSFNELAAGLGYEEAKVIVDGQVTTEAGGGLCQVSSTLYNAANDAGLEVVERAPHSAELSYIRPGLDATVWFGAGGTQELDMKFRNTTDANILIRETVRNDGYVYAEIWGRPTGTEVDLDSERVSASGGSIRWVTYKTVERNGETVAREQLHTDTYEPLDDEEGNPVPNSEAAPADW